MKAPHFLLAHAADCAASAIAARSAARRASVARVMTAMPASKPKTRATTLPIAIIVVTVPDPRSSAKCIGAPSERRAREVAEG